MKPPPPRIGILTFHNGPNYGGFLQAWHLRNAVRQAGHDCDVVNYLHPTHAQANKVDVRVRNLAGVKTKVHWTLKKHPFRDAGKVLCNDPFTSSAASVPWKSFSGIIVGSDVVWDFQTPAFGHDPVYFGGGPEQAHLPHASYAASCGAADVGNGLPAFTSGLKHFVSHAVRDSASADLVERVTGARPPLVVDPTWLHPDPPVRWLRAPRKPYVLLYGAGLSKETAAELRIWCHRRGLGLVSAATPCHAADRVYRMLSPFQWVDLFRNASATIVGSLHGTLYSIKYGKPFILMNNSRTRQKAKEAVARTGMAARDLEPEQVNSSTFHLLEAGSEPVPQIPAEWREESLNHLTRGLVLLEGR